MVIVFLLLIVCVSPARTNLAAFQNEALLQHNFRRQQHCVPLMTLNATLNTIAQNYANYLATNNLFQHSGASGLGENLWKISSSGTLGYINGSRPTESWYSEIVNYNFSSPGFASNTGHFTQVVWRNSIQLGMGIAYSSNNRSAYVVANYLPAGNVIGSFATNVPRLCTGNSTTMTTISTSSGSVTTRAANSTVVTTPSTTVSTSRSSTSTVATTTVTPMNLVSFRNEALQQHNFRRQQHCVPLMTLNATLNTIAQNYANYLAANSLFQHSGASGLGENLWMISSSGTLGYINGSRPTESWYSEIVNYNFSAPGFASNTGHFTQVVWRNSIQLGMGIAYSSNNRSAYVVANYLPAGNVIGSFATNVPRVCTGTTTTVTRTTTSTSVLTNASSQSSTTTRITNTTSMLSSLTSSTVRTMNSTMPSTTVPTTTTALTSFQREALAQANFWRQFHCVTPLVMNSTLNTIAQSWAEYLTSNRVFLPSGSPCLGESLMSMSVSGGLGYVNGSVAIDRWYSQILMYNSSRPEISGTTIDFTQLIWKETTQFGIGIAFTSDKKTVNIVANFHPAGNVPGAVSANVLPLCVNRTNISTSG